MMRTIALAGLAVSVLGSTAAAQGNALEKPQRQILERRVAEQRHALLRKGAEVSRLMDLLVRDSLGMPSPAAEFELTDGERTLERAAVEAGLQDGVRHVAALAAELDQKRSHLEDLRRARPASTEPQPATRRQGIPEAPFEASGKIPAAPPGAPAQRTPTTRRQTERPTHQPPPRAHTPTTRTHGAEPHLVHGTLDHGRLGRAAYRAGDYEAARDKLEVSTRGQDVPLLDLFLLAKTYEKLGDHARADGTLIRLEEADTERKIDGTPVPGPWATAAQTARQHLNWMRDHRTWTPRFPWHDQKQQPQR